jgi:hypothetical protein
MSRTAAAGRSTAQPTPPSAPVDAVTRRRLAAQLLTEPGNRTPDQVTLHLLAVQAQDPRGARLAMRARSTGLGVEHVEEALTSSRSLLVSWLNRGTLQLVHRDDYAWLQALTTPQLATGNARRLAQEGVTPDAADAGVRLIARELRNGPMTRRQLRERLDAAGIPTQGQALVQLLVRSAIAGDTVRGPMTGGEQGFVLVRDWLGEPPRMERDAALAELARRFLRGHGPACEPDLARWAGVTLGDARRGLASIAGELDDVGAGLVDLRGRVGVDTVPAPRLLGPFDPVLLGWTSRADIIGAHVGLVTDNGLFRPFAMVGGRAVATWSMTGRQVAVRPLEPIADAVLAALAEDGRDVQRFFGW